MKIKVEKAGSIFYNQSMMLKWNMDLEVNTTKSHCCSPLKATCTWIW